MKNVLLIGGTFPSEVFINCFRSDGYMVSHIIGSGGIKKIKAQESQISPDLIILAAGSDVNINKICKALKDIRDVPIILLLPRTEEREATRVYEEITRKSGADDYMLEHLPLYVLLNKVKKFF